MTPTKRTFVPEDLYRLVQVGDPQIHPDGDVVAFVRSHVEGDKKELRSHIWIAPLGANGISGTGLDALRPGTRGTTLDAPRPYTRGPRRDGQPHWSPDGRRLAFVRQTGDGPDADRQIWIIDREGGEAWPLTSMRHGVSHFVWSPDSSRIAFVAALGDDESDDEACTPKTDGDKKREKQQALDEAKHITRFQYKLDHAGIFPPRRSHVWIVDVPHYAPAPVTSFEDESPGEGEGAQSPASPRPRRITREPFNHSLLDWSPDGRSIACGASYEDERKPVHDIWIFPVPGGESSRSSEGDDQLESDKANASDGAKEADTAPIKLTAGDGLFYEARWSPDGQSLAVVGHLREHRSATMNRLWQFPAPGALGGSEGNGARQRICLTEAWDRGIGGIINSDFRPGMAGSGLTWAPDGSGVYFVADDHGRTQLYRQPVPASETIAPADTPTPADPSAATDPSAPAHTSAPELIAGGPAEIYGFSLNRDGNRAAIARADMLNPGDIYVLDAESDQPTHSAQPDQSTQSAPSDRSDKSDQPSKPNTEWSPTRVTAVNEALLARIEMPTIEEITFEAADGLSIHGWIMRPVSASETAEGASGSAPESRPKSASGAEPKAASDSLRAPQSGPAPAVLQIHGGPHTAWGHSFSLEMHLQAAMGYAVIFVNPRGSTSYGQQFARGCLNDYGGRDYEDLMAAVDHAIALGGIDAKRLAVTGGSYGGFMTNWIVTQTNRFRAGISHRSISNWISFWGVSDIGPRFMDGEFGHESLWSGFDDMWERSPLKHARNVETPLLICHSEHDLRCPMEQAEQFYLALKWEGKPAELLRHPRSNHDLTRTGPPTLRVDRFHHIARFLREHVGR